MGAVGCQAARIAWSEVVGVMYDDPPLPCLCPDLFDCAAEEEEDEGEEEDEEEEAEESSSEEEDSSDNEGSVELVSNRLMSAWHACATNQWMACAQQRTGWLCVWIARSPVSTLASELAEHHCRCRCLLPACLFIPLQVPACCCLYINRFRRRAWPCTTVAVATECSFLHVAF